MSIKTQTVFSVLWLVLSVIIFSSVVWGENKTKSSTTLSKGFTVSGPIIINGESDVIISGLHTSNPNGICVSIGDGSNNIIIKNSEIGPCGGNAVDIRSSSNITIQNNYIHDSVGEGVYLFSAELIEVTNNKIERVRTGVYTVSSEQVDVNYNEFRNMQGPFPRGQAVQYTYAEGGGNRISNNVSINELGASDPEDAINIYRSNGLPEDPIMINDNLIIGGGPSSSGGGIVLGDGGESSYQIVKDNILVNPGQYGVAIAGGHHQQLLNNSVYGKQFPFANVGLHVWDQYDSDCADNTVRANRINYTNRDGIKNSRWNAGNCGIVDGWSDNDWDASIGEEVAEQHPGLVNTNITVASVTASSSQSLIEHGPQNTIDDDFTSRWSAEGEQWIHYDLADVFIVTQLDIAFFRGDARSYVFDIELSVDGTEWTQVFNGQSSGNTSNLESFDFTAALAKFVRINGYGSNANNWNNYLEVDVIASAPAYYQQGLIFKDSFEP